MQADRIYCGDALTVLKTLPDNSVNCCITSPPYYALRDYGVDGQLGREETPKALTPSTPTAGPVRWSPSTARWRAARQRT